MSRPSASVPKANRAFFAFCCASIVEKPRLRPGPRPRLHTANSSPSPLSNAHSPGQDFSSGQDCSRRKARMPPSPSRRRFRFCCQAMPGIANCQAAATRTRLPDTRPFSSSVDRSDSSFRLSYLACVLLLLQNGVVLIRRPLLTGW